MRPRSPTLAALVAGAFVFAANGDDAKNSPAKVPASGIAGSTDKTSIPATTNSASAKKPDPAPLPPTKGQPATKLKEEAATSQKKADQAPPSNLSVPPPAANEAAAKEGAVLETEVKSWVGLAKRLTLLGGAKLQPAAGIWGALSADAQAAAKTIADEKGSDKDRTTLLTAVNSLLSQRSLAEKLGYKTADVRDIEAGALIELLPKLTDIDVRRLNRALLESAFPFELAQHRPDGRQMQRYVNVFYPPPPSAPNESRYPPPATSTESQIPTEVTLEITVPRLRGRLLAAFESGDSIVFLKGEKQTLKVKNSGQLRYRLQGDSDVVDFPRTLQWEPKAVDKSGKLAESLKLFGG